jgi:hypothetical protein
MATTYTPPTTGTPIYPDVVGGQIPTQTNGNPIFPGTLLTGPILAGSIQSSDGTNTLGNVGETQGTSNVGYCVMAKSCVVTQATNVATTGLFQCPIVIPAQSQILGIYLMVTTAWTTTTTTEIGSNASATAFTASQAVTGVGTLGQIIIPPGTGATQIGNWDNVGTQDVQIVVTSGSTGSGVGTLTVIYIQGNNMAS